jgi:hypothetical protein
MPVIILGTGSIPGLGLCKDRLLVGRGDSYNWVTREDFLRTRTTFNSWMRGKADAEGPWRPLLRAVFEDEADEDMLAWLTTRPHDFAFQWTSENDKRGYSVPRFDAFQIVFEKESEAILFKLTFGGNKPR